ncbi:hypothetical protein SCA6_019975 [Theobroma cacao]
MAFSCVHSISYPFSPWAENKVRRNEVAFLLDSGFSICRISYVKCSQKLGEQSLSISEAVEKKPVKKVGKNEHHLWKKRDSAGSGQKALNLVRIISQLPDEKEAVYGALDKWTAWETEFPLIAAAKALRILRKRSQWLRVIQVCSYSCILYLRALK